MFIEHQHFIFSPKRPELVINVSASDPTDIPVLLHYMFKRPEEIFLKTEVCKFSFFKELHGKLPQGIHSKDGHILIGITADLPREQVMQVRLNSTLISSPYRVKG